MQHAEQKSTIFVLSSNEIVKKVGNVHYFYVGHETDLYKWWNKYSQCFVLLRLKYKIKSVANKKYEVKRGRIEKCYSTLKSA